MQLHIEAACSDCDPYVIVEAVVGHASLRFRSHPMARKTGMEFAQAILADAQNRSSFLTDLLEPERRYSSERAVDGDVDGVSTIDSLGMIVATVRAECNAAPRQAEGRVLLRLRWAVFV
jgi:hypothetical protein